MDDQMTNGKTDLLEQRLPVPIEPSERQEDKRFQITRLSMVAGQTLTLRYPVLPDTYLIAAATGGTLEVCLGPTIQSGQTITVASGSWVRIAGVDHYLTLRCTGANVEGYVMAEAGYANIGVGSL